jgi:hypothetical protein
MIIYYLIFLLLGIMIGAVGMAVLCMYEVNRYMNEEMDDDYEYL